MENVLISSKPIEISDYKTYKEAVFLISVLDEWDLNNRLIPKDVGEKYHKTIIGFPIVAKLIRDKYGTPIDFRGHEMKVIIDDNGNMDCKFDTMPIGSVLDSWIEQREVAGYEGLKDCIMIRAKLWSDRFPEYFEVLDKLWASNNVKSSWELAVEKCEKTIKGKIIKAFSFLGNALLGSDVDGAVPGAGVYEYAQLSNDLNTDEYVLASALSNDCSRISDIKNEAKEGIMPEIKNAEEAEIEKTADVSEEKVEETTPVAENKEEASESKEQKIDSDVEKAEESPEVPETSDTEEPKISEVAEIEKLQAEIATKNDALLKANEEIQTLKAENESLLAYKERCEKEDAEKAEAEIAAKKEQLVKYALDSKQITKAELETDEFKTIISELDETKLKAIISDRLVSSFAKRESKVETSEINKEIPKANLNTVEDDNDYRTIISNYLNK